MSTPHSDTVESFLARLRDEDVGEGRVQMLAEMCEVYATLGLLPGGRDEPLWGCCPCLHPCWHGRAAARPVREDRAGVSAPWLGDGYGERFRVAVLGTNLHDFGGLSANWDMCRAHRDAQQQGERGFKGEWFALGAMSYLRLTLCSLAGHEPAFEWRVRPDHEVAPELAPLWNDCAFLEGVKCAPSKDASKPFPEMFERCPELLLKRELGLLRPNLILLFGRSRLRDPVRRVLGAREWEHSDGMEREVVDLASGPAELVSLNHPSRPQHVETSLRSLAASFRAMPAGQKAFRAPALAPTVGWTT